jgi:formylglycine-generating enzyme required for sulfatase activity
VNGANFGDCDEGRIEIKTYLPNGYGLFDMTGNVSEWTADWYDENYYAISPQNNPEGPQSGDTHVFRGGSVIYGTSFMNLSRRWVDVGWDFIGFRCVLSED